MGKREPEATEHNRIHAATKVAIDALDDLSRQVEETQNRVGECHIESFAIREIQKLVKALRLQGPHNASLERLGILISFLAAEVGNARMLAALLATESTHALDADRLMRAATSAAAACLKLVASLMGIVPPQLVEIST